MAKPIKTLQQLSSLGGIGKSSLYQAMDQLDLYGDSEQLEIIIKQITDINKKYYDQVALAKDLNKLIKEQQKVKFDMYHKDNKQYELEGRQARALKKHLVDVDKLEKEITKHKQDELDLEKKTLNEQGAKVKKTLEYLKVLNSVKKEGQEIFKIAHDMQLQNNITWAEFTKLQSAAYKAARDLNGETGKQLHTAKEMVEMQNALLKGGWKGIDAQVLTNVSSATRMIATTLGEFPEELSTAFKMSYRQFGEQTDGFITSMGNRLNAFSDTFGMSVGMMVGAVTQMSANTSFIFRNNAEAQLRANESLMKAAALSGRIGLTSTEFINQLGNISQFGTADEVAGLYQGGALLQGFDTGQFQQDMMSGNADAATRNLFSSIYDTMQGVGNDQYLRNEYMRQIGGSFGLSQDDILQIMTNGGNLDNYSQEIQDKLLGVNTSMKDEVSGFKMDLLDQLENTWTNSKISEGYNKVMQGLGLYGISGLLSVTNLSLFNINRQVTAINAQQKLNMTKGNIPGGDMVGKAGMSGMQKVGLGLGGAAIGIGGNVLGSNIQGNTNMSNTAANALGGTINVASGAAGGALIGTMIAPGIGTAIGAGLGAAAGAVNTFVGAKKRESAMEQIENDRRKAARQTLNTNTTDPVVNAINSQTNALAAVISGETNKVVEANVTAKIYDRTTTKGNLLNEY